MADTIIPINADATSGDPKYAARAARQTMVAVPLAGATAVRPFGVRSGVRPGTSTAVVAMSLSGTTPTWTVNPHAGVVDAQTSTIAGPYEYAFDVAKTGQLAAQDGTNARVDLVCVQVSDTDEDGSGFRKVDVVTVTGTANGSLPIPATPARSMVLAQVNVPKSGGGTPTVTWVAPYLAAAGAEFGVQTLAQLNAITGGSGLMRARVLADPTAVNNTGYVWSGSAWQRQTLFASGVFTGAVAAAGTTSIAHGLPGTPTVQITQMQHPTIDINSRYFQTILWNAPNSTTFNVRNIDRRDNSWAGDQAVRFSWTAILPGA